MSRRGGGVRGGGVVSVDNSEQFKALEELMHLQARRDFLLEHMKELAKFSNQSYTTPATSTTAPVDNAARKEALKNEIASLEDYFASVKSSRSDLTDYVDGVLVSKVGTDADGISTRLAKHFAQLSADKKEQPFVLLDQSGAQLYWNKKSDAEKFARFLEAHGVKAEIKKATLGDDQLPEVLQMQECDSSYRGKDCHTVVVPHLHVESLLALAQYHSYSLKPVASDWYAARKLNRGQLVTQEATQDRRVHTANFPVEVLETTRVRFSDKEDVVKVTLAGRTNKSQSKPHVVILLDDSYSMKGEAMNAANAALEKFVKSLPDDTLVSIQPFNEKTTAFRATAGELKKHPGNCFTTPATGGTPLVEILVNSAVFLRKSPSDLTIDDESIDNTTVVLLTDGQANGSAKDAVASMQTSANARMLGAIDSIKVGVTRDNFVSYGLNGFMCRRLPAILPISIGADSDVMFMRELAQTFHMPEAFVKTDSNMQQDIDHAMGLMHCMLRRVPQVFVGLSFDSNGQTDAVGVEEHNLFDSQTREVYFKVPRGATNLQLCRVIGTDTRALSGSALTQQASTDATVTGSIVNEYVAQQLFELKMGYSKAVQALSGGADAYAGHGGRFGGTRFGGTRFRGGRFDEEETQAASTEKPDATAAKFDSLKAEVIQKAKVLLVNDCSQTTKADIELFISSVSRQQNFYQSIQSVHPSRGDVAKYTQGRNVGRQVDFSQVQVLSRRGSPIFEKIQQGQFSVAQKMMQDDPTVLNQKSRDQYQATPLISAVALLSRMRGPVEQQPTGIKETELSDFIDFMFSDAQAQYLDVTAQDAQDQTALHRAAWYGQFDVCQKLIEVAQKKNQLGMLKRKTNKNMEGATVGATVLGDIRRSPKLDASQKETLQRALSVACDAKDYKKDLLTVAQLNAHLEPHWNTPVMQLLRDLRDENDPEVKKIVRAKIHELLDTDGLDLLESNFNGDTALHYAIWYGEFALAQKIIEKAEKAGDLALLLAARNSTGSSAQSGGEVPHMNLTLAGKNAFPEFQKVFDAVQSKLSMLQLTSSDFARACETFSSLGDAIDYLVTNGLISQEIRAQYNNLGSWLELSKSLVSELPPAAKAECYHLMQLYGKELQGYGTMNFLHASPLHEKQRLLDGCAALKCRNTTAIGELEKRINGLAADCSLKSVRAQLQWVNDQLTQHAARLSTSGFFAGNGVVALYRSTRGFLVQYAAHLTGEMATLQQMVANTTATSARKADSVPQLIADLSRYMSGISQNYTGDVKYKVAQQLYLDLIAINEKKFDKAGIDSFLSNVDSKLKDLNAARAELKATGSNRLKGYLERVQKLGEALKGMASTQESHATSTSTVQHHTDPAFQM